MGRWGRGRLPCILFAVMALVLGTAEAALAAPAGSRVIDPGTDLGTIVAIAVMGTAGGLLLAIVADRQR